MQDEFETEKTKNLMGDLLFLMDSLLPMLYAPDRTDLTPAFIENVKQVTQVYNVDFSLNLADRIMPLLFKISEQTNTQKVKTDIVTIIEKCLSLPEEIIISSLKPYQMSTFIIQLLEDRNSLEQALRITNLILSKSSCS